MGWHTPGISVNGFPGGDLLVICVWGGGGIVPWAGSLAKELTYFVTWSKPLADGQQPPGGAAEVQKELEPPLGARAKGCCEENMTAVLRTVPHSKRDRHVHTKQAVL